MHRKVHIEDTNVSEAKAKLEQLNIFYGKRKGGGESTHKIQQRIGRRRKELPKLDGS